MSFDLGFCLFCSRVYFDWYPVPEVKSAILKTNKHLLKTVFQKLKTKLFDFTNSKRSAASKISNTSPLSMHI